LENESDQLVKISKTSLSVENCSIEKLASKDQIAGIEFLIDRTNLDYFSLVYPRNAKNDYCLINP